MKMEDCYKVFKLNHPPKFINPKEESIMSNYEEFESMITYGFHYKCSKFFTGKQIKDIILRCLSDESIVGARRDEIVVFSEKYINSKYPLADNTLYSLSWSGDDMTELKCYKHP